ncbi:MAG TPA: aminofutalosine synthase MqnE [Bacteroidales bacterium]|nr:aminofutalosine synthase MqnE [Bacteroidales bacterium]HRR48463.1 aminofutalosine synthase MqnE [Bacteroidales bacterium]HRT32884.1 aminofutalosine synthase MqnE [Bacteroidales bacterium]HRT84431.1 aminofutalosine synthase MqnE [Bacteroidales bacterium]
MERDKIIKEALELYSTSDMNSISEAALKIRKAFNGNKVYYNNNFHIEPSNICVHRCKFCSYRRDNSSQPGAWSMTLEDVRNYCREKYQKGMTEVHVVGSVHPEKSIDYYVSIISLLRKELPDEVTIKAYTAVEIDDMARYSGQSVEYILNKLKDAGLSAMPGGGAEIFDSDIRKQICPDKCNAERWIEIHRTAHKLGIRSNATMLFGHIENRRNRLDHMLQIKELQEETGGFDAFIPLLFKSTNNQLSHLGEIGFVEILKTFAVARVVLDNIPHIKSYWPMLGKDLSQLTLLYGADDMDGTINNSTKIYSMAGSHSNPEMSCDEIENMARECGFIAIERDSFYNEVKK